MFGTFPSRAVWRRPGLRPVDLLVFAALLALLFGLLRLAPALNAPFLPKTAPSLVSTDPANLPYYAVRSLLRMFIALGISLVFTFVYATAWSWCSAPGRPLNMCMCTSAWARSARPSWTGRSRSSGS